MAGISDRHQIICFALALWNGSDPILKERLFGLTGTGQPRRRCQGLLLLPRLHPHALLHEISLQISLRWLFRTGSWWRRTAAEVGDLEYRVDRHGSLRRRPLFRCLCRVCQGGAEDILVRISVANRGPEAASLHLLPTLWFRNTWRWSDDSQSRSPGSEGTPPVRLRRASRQLGDAILLRGHAGIALHRKRNQPRAALRRCQWTPICERRHQRLHRSRRKGAVNPAQTGTKVAAHYH